VGVSARLEIWGPRGWADDSAGQGGAVATLSEEIFPGF
jgi:DNA-binding transcriptional regulator/RsmH inhibitor MraZ